MTGLWRAPWLAGAGRVAPTRAGCCLADSGGGTSPVSTWTNRLRQPNDQLLDRRCRLQ